MLALSAVYAAFGNVGLVAGIFYGLKAAVLAIVLQAVVRIGRRSLEQPRADGWSRPPPSSRSSSSACRFR